jgi:hypothetical protein
VNAAIGTAVRRARGAVWGAALLVLCTAGTARAQDVEPLPERTWAIKAGAFFPTQGALRNQSGSPYHYIGVDFNPNLRYKPLSASTVFSAEFMWRDSGGKTFLTIPLTLRLLWNITPMESRFRVYGGLGGGIYFINTGFIGGTTQAGMKFTLGVDLNERWLIETNYDWVSGFSDNLGNGIRVDGLTFALGYRY